MKRAANKPTAVARQELLEFLRANPGSTVVQINQGTTLNDTAIRKNLNIMAREGLTVRTPGDHSAHEPDTWSAPPAVPPAYTVSTAAPGKGWEVLRRSPSGTTERLLTYTEEAAAVEIAHRLNGWAGREL